MNTSSRQTRSIALAVTLSAGFLLLPGCDAPAGEAGSGSDTTDQGVSGELPGVIFPDDSIPGATCQPGALTCPNRFTLTYPSNLITAAQRFRTFTQTVTSSITSNGAQIACIAPSDVVITGIVNYGGSIPTNVKVTQTATGVQFDRPVDNSFLTPFPGAGASCGIECTNPSSAPRGCNRAELSASRRTGQLSINGGPARTISLDGSVDQLQFDPQFRSLSLTCKWTLHASQLGTSQARPDDVIAVGSGGQFIRGYSLSPSARASACATLAQKVCQPNGAQRLDGIVETCITPRTNQCIAQFSGPDPCATACVACSDSSSCGIHQTCNNGCCSGTPN